MDLQLWDRQLIRLTPLCPLDLYLAVGHRQRVDIVRRLYPLDPL